MNEGILAYIRQNRTTYTREALIQSLLQAGFSLPDIETAWRVLEAEDKIRAYIQQNRTTYPKGTINQQLTGAGFLPAQIETVWQTESNGYSVPPPVYPGQLLPPQLRPDSAPGSGRRFWLTFLVVTGGLSLLGAIVTFVNDWGLGILVPAVLYLALPAGIIGGVVARDRGQPGSSVLRPLIYAFVTALVGLFVVVAIVAGICLVIINSNQP